MEGEVIRIRSNMEHDCLHSKEGRRRNDAVGETLKKEFAARNYVLVLKMISVVT